MLEANHKWAARMVKENPSFFDSNARSQQPPVLWIGCADSRVPANEVTGTRPGDIFVHRNIANMVVHSDMNMLSVLDYGVNVLEVKHVIVCGHYGCGGVKAAMGNQQFGLIDNWLRHIKDVYRLHREELDSIENEDARFDRLVEVNVIEQVFDLCKTSIIQNAWEKRNGPEVHGWVYDIRTGLIKDLEITVKNNNEMHRVYQFNASQMSVKDISITG